MSHREPVKPSRRKPKMGQTFLADRSAAARIVEALGDVSGQTVIEIGPGKGALTDVLAPRPRRLICIELDRVMAAQLRMKFATQRNVEVVEADVLTVDFANLLRGRPDQMSVLKPEAPEQADVVGNLPYYITSDILLHLFDHAELLRQVVIMVQKEVADRIAAKPGTRDYGLLTATTQLFAKVEKLFTLPPGAFAPPPKVHSTVLRMTMQPQAKELGVDIAGFVEFLKLSFGQKRKTLLNNLKEKYEPARVTAALKSARVRNDVRAEALSLEKAAQIYKSLALGS